MKLKMYIVLRCNLSPAQAVVAAAHAALGTYLTFESDEQMQTWRHTSFAKVMLRARDEAQFELAKTIGEHRVFTESTLRGLEVAIGFKPMPTPSLLFKEFPLWTPT